MAAASAPLVPNGVLPLRIPLLPFRLFSYLYGELAEMEESEEILVAYTAEQREESQFAGCQGQM